MATKEADISSDDQYWLDRAEKEDPTQQPQQPESPVTKEEARSVYATQGAGMSRTEFAEEFPAEAAALGFTR